MSLQHSCCFGTYALFTRNPLFCISSWQVYCEPIIHTLNLSATPVHVFYSQTRCIIEQQWDCDLHKTLRRFLKSAAFSKTLLEYAGHGDITARN